MFPLKNLARKGLRVNRDSDLLLWFQGLSSYLEEGMLPSILLPEASDKLKVLADCCEDTIPSNITKPATQTLAQQQEAVALQQATTLRELGFGAYKNLLQLAMESSSVAPPTPVVVTANEKEQKKLVATEPAVSAPPTNFAVSTHWGRNKIADILQKTYPNAFCWMKSLPSNL